MARADAAVCAGTPFGPGAGIVHRPVPVFQGRRTPAARQDLSGDGRR